MTTSPPAGASARDARPPTTGGFGELAALVSDAGLPGAGPPSLPAADRGERRPARREGLVVFVRLGPSWWQLLTAVFLAVVTTQRPSSATTRATGRCSPDGAGTTSWATCTAGWSG
ncbi:hypothetical protein [Pseudonocardia sp. ICBG1142]|uniref:hypothetical protein n=1 Tax=Pseudonocardia sp. ICBG1142 TaxID=2846760 RepID=UPI001CF6E791|nr:hypothetical protein [Pseudonocardia sp. ICBG1142]